MPLPRRGILAFMAICATLPPVRPLFARNPPALPLPLTANGYVHVCWPTQLGRRFPHFAPELVVYDDPAQIPPCALCKRSSLGMPSLQSTLGLPPEGHSSWSDYLSVPRDSLDITYIPMARDFVYLAAVVDWVSQRVLAWRVSMTMEVDFCLEAVGEALAKHGRPAIFNTDQGSQFTNAAFTGLLLENGIAISMDGRGAWRDNIFVERLWRSINYEEVVCAARQSR